MAKQSNHSTGNTSTLPVLYAPDPDPETGGQVDGQHADRRIWLVKVPLFLYERWFPDDSDTQPSEQDIGVVRIHPRPSHAPAKAMPPVSLHLHPDTARDLPSSFDLVFNTEIPWMHSFTESRESGRALAIMGRVEYECLVRPQQMTAAYQKLIQKRTQIASLPQRQTMLVDSSSKAVISGFLKPTSHSAASQEALRQRRLRGHGVSNTTGPAITTTTTNVLGEVQTTTLEERRERMPQEALLAWLFRAFEQYPYWSLRGLADQSQQPIPYCRLVLQEIAELKRTGVYRGLYELKQEYQRNVKRSESVATAMASASLKRKVEEEELEDTI